MAIVAVALSLLLAVLGAVGIVVPNAFLTISRPFLTPAGLYAAAAFRLVLGTSLVVAAPSSRAPKAIRILGVGIFLVGLVTPLIGVERARVIVEWWVAQGPAFLRVWASFALAFGLFLAYAVAARTPHSDRF